MTDERWNLGEIQICLDDSTARRPREHVLSDKSFRALLLTARDGLTRAQPSEGDRERANRLLANIDREAKRLEDDPEEEICSLVAMIAAEFAAVRAGCPEDWRERAMRAVRRAYALGHSPEFDAEPDLDAIAARILDAAPEGGSDDA